MSLLLSNNILQAAEKKLESQLTPENHQDYLKVVVAGLKVALQKGPDSAMAALRNSKDPINDCAIGAINLCLLMRKQSRGTMPVKAMVPAAMTLMLHALDFVDNFQNTGDLAGVQVFRLPARQAFSGCEDPLDGDGLQGGHDATAVSRSSRLECR